MEEVKRLREAFMRIQTEELVQKITESQCVEILAKLRELRLIEIIPSVDGKEFVTPDRLHQETQAELSRHNGRISVSELQLLLGVDSASIENVIQRLLKEAAPGSLYFVQNELLTNEYLDNVARQADALLQLRGYITFADVSHHVNLPFSFLQTALETRIGTQLHGSIDPGSRGKVQTDAFVRRQEARIRGVFCAITTPTSVSTLLQRYEFHDSTFKSTLDELIASGQIPGAIKRGVYEPHVYTRVRLQAASSFLEQNGWIEYEQLKRIGIEDHRSFVKGRAGVELPFTFMAEPLTARIDAMVDEALTADGYCDIKAFMPPHCGDADAQALTARLPCLAGDKTRHVVAGACAVTDAFVTACLQLFDPELQRRAFRNITCGGLGKGADSSKQRRASNQKAEPALAELFTIEEVVSLLKDRKAAADMDDAFWSAVAEALQKPLAARYQEHLATAFAGNESSGRVAGAEKKFVTCLAAFGALAKGAAKVTADQKAFRKHLLRTVGTELVKAMYEREALESDTEATPSQLATGESRAELAKTFSPRVQAALAQLEDDLRGNDLNAFAAHVQGSASLLQLEAGSRGKDDAEKEFLANHIAALKKELAKTDNPAATLHLAAMILFQYKTSCAISAPAKNVPSLVTSLQPLVSAGEHDTLVTFQQLVIQSVGKAASPDEAKKVADALASMLPTVKSMSLGET